MNALGLDYNGVGNHEFDEGIAELLRMQYGNRPHDGDFDSGGGVVGPRGLNPGNGCHPVDGCGSGTPFRGSRPSSSSPRTSVYQSEREARSSRRTRNPPGFQRGVKVAFVGMTLEGTPDLIVSLRAACRQRRLPRRGGHGQRARAGASSGKGVETIVVLLHEGGSATGLPHARRRPSTSAAALPGALPPIVAAMDDEIDVVVTGHTNWAVNCVIDGKVVTGAASQGRLITDIDLTIGRHDERRG